MDFNLNDEQVALRDATRDLLKKYDPNVDAEKRRQVTATEPGYDPAVWAQLADMGLLGLLFSEADGGMGATMVEVGVVAQELGRVAAPEPYVAAVILAGGLVAAAGSSEQRNQLLPGLVAGEQLVAYAVGGGADPVVADPVVAGVQADTIVWQANGKLWLSPRPQATSYSTFDGTHAAALTFDPDTATPLGDGSTRSLDLVRAQAQIAACNEALGLMDTSLSMTTQYLKTRQQFGVTLNRFQSLTFRAADLYTALELTRSLVAWATMVASEITDQDQVVAAAARASLQTARAAQLIGQEAIQLHGGIGVTAEYAVGWYTARLTALSNWLLQPRAQLHRLGQTLTDYTVLDPLA